MESACSWNHFDRKSDHTFNLIDFPGRSKDWFLAALSHASEIATSCHHYDDDGWSAALQRGMCLTASKSYHLRMRIFSNEDLRKICWDEDLPNKEDLTSNHLISTKGGHLNHRARWVKISLYTRDDDALLMEILRITGNDIEY